MVGARGARRGDRRCKGFKGGRGGREAARAREEERAHTVPEKESGNASIGYLPICEKSSHTDLSRSLSPPSFNEVYACACVVSPLRGAQAGGMEG